MKKYLAFALAVMTASLFATGTIVDETITPQGVVQIDLDSDQAALWIPYPGDLSNVCGIKLKAASRLIDAKSLFKAIELVNGSFLPGKDSLLEATVFSGPTTSYGMRPIVKTKSGETFGQVIDAILKQQTSSPQYEPRLLVVEAKLCH